MRKIILMLVLFVFVSTLVACGRGDEGGGGEGGMQESGDCSGGGWCGEQAINLTANIGESEALFIQSESSSVISSESVPLGEEVLSGKVVTVSSASPLFSVTNEGIVGALVAAYDDNSDALADLPRLSFVAVSPAKHVILVFEYSFIFTEVAADGTPIEEYSDPWAASSPFSCQIFVVNKKIQDAAADEQLGLTCITTDLELNTWDFRSSMIQFDGDGGVYFSAHVPQNWKNVLLKWTPGTDDPATSEDESVNGTLSEVINVNICFREFLVTNEGGVLYTGITSTSGDCDGTSFLRYKTPAGVLQEITSGWWEYVFKPIESTDFVNTNIAANITEENIGQILFYGPNPELATTPEWDDACLFKFNPDASGTARSVQIADCDIDIWQYVDWAPDMDTKRTRCTEVKSMLGGGNVPEKILLADFNGDGAIHEIYVIGDVYEKMAGEWRCNLCTTGTVANYCSANNNLHFEATAGTCAAVDDDSDGTADGSWGTSDNCFHQQADSSSTGNICQTSRTDFDVNHQWCESPGGDWRSTYSAFVLVTYDDNDTTDESDDTRQITRYSDDDEIVRNGWVIDNRLIYSSFNATDGTYKLREIIWMPSAEGDTTVDVGELTKTDLLTGIEVYELFADPRSDYAGKWFLNGLRFSNNQYITGTLDPDAADPSATLLAEEGITGQIETLVIVPE